MYANVVFPVSKSLIFYYKVPLHLENNVLLGQRVLVPLGKTLKSAIIISKVDHIDIPEDKVKEIHDIEDMNPIMSEELLKLCIWVSEYYCCSIGQVIRQFMSGAMHKIKIKENKRLNKRELLGFKLTNIQENASKKIAEHIDSNKHHVALVHGVTGSGKTLVYIDLIKKCIREDKSVLMLVPEIGLVEPLRKVVEKYINDPIAVLHSNMSAGKRYTNWMMAKEGKVKVVIGARSAVWVPLINIGLIIVDEEHDNSYKQSDGVPRYNARDVAIYRAYLNSSVVILGSATPSVESYSNALSGKYSLINMQERYGNAQMPDILVVDMREEHKSGNWSFFSKSLMNGIKETLEKKEQIILLLNRRGFSHMLLCKQCGHVEKCPYCDISTTYHSTDNTLRCHYCGYQKRAPDKCSECGSLDVKFQGIGVQKVENEIGRYFPDAKVERMDADTTKRRNSHSKILKKFASGDTDILIGTQMVAKGLDFPNVTLVGIISADTGLNMPDFRAAENTFQMLSQVAGRAGRGEKKGSVVLQTYSPQEYSIVNARNHDYLSFYEEETKNREALNYPPLTRLLQINISHTSQKVLFNSVQKLTALLKKEDKDNKITILGPAPAPLSKQKNRYRYLILLKSKSSKAMHELVKKSIFSFESGSLRIIIDVDPIFML